MRRAAIMFPSAPTVGVTQVHKASSLIEASPWLVQNFSFGLQLSWTREKPYRRPRLSPLAVEETRFVQEEAKRWKAEGFARKST